MTSRSFRFEGARAGAAVEVPYEVAGDGPDVLLLPALSAVSARAEMRPLAGYLEGFRRVLTDWPGFGDGSRPRVDLRPDTFRRFLDDFAREVLRPPAAVVAAGHAAPYALVLACARPDLVSRLVLVAPTWRGPLPTAMGEHRRPLWARLRRAIEAPVVGPLLYRLNVARPMLGKMMRAHVYADPARVTPGVLDAKAAITRRKNARFSTAAFVTGGLDPVLSRADFLALASPPPVPLLVLHAEGTPPKSSAEVAALMALPGVTGRRVPGALAAHEEHPEEVAAAVRAFLAETAPLPQPA